MAHGETIPFFSSITTLLGYGILMAFGWLREFLGSFFTSHNKPPKGYAPLVSDFDDFYTRRLYHRIHDCWNRPIASCPGAWMDVCEREPLVYGKPLRLLGTTKHALNLGSYNYLGFGDPDSPTKVDVFKALEQFSVATCSTRSALGTTTIHRQLEKTVARFVRKEDAMVFGMGFGTNSTGIPSLIGKGGLLISDSNNHSSIVVGARTSGAAIKVFAHNDPEDLEAVLREAILEGQPRTHRPWKKIMIMVEGIYSMEGQMCPLAAIVALKKKYRCYLYVDEAHSIGAIGPTGRGICEHAKVNPADVDILMGTFTKSFGAVGGYVAGNRDLIAYLRAHCAGSVYSASISPPATQQVISAMKIIMGEDGTDIGKKKLTALRENSNMFRRLIHAMGCHVLGDWDSPIVPVMLYNPAKIPCFSRECLRRGIAVVVVGFPASPLLLARTRFCISAAHKKEDLEEAVKIIGEVAAQVGIRYGQIDLPPAIEES
jgi:serine palmitoyltransferase